MKRISQLFFALALVISMISCTKDDKNDSTISAEEAGVNAKIDIANDDVSNIVEEEENNTLTWKIPSQELSIRLSKVGSKKFHDLQLVFEALK